ncbi:unnamed protein product, partial [Rotaria sp. Silwood1]
FFYNHKDRRYCKRDYPPENFILQCNLKLYQTIIWDRVSTVNQNFDYFRSNLENNFLHLIEKNSHPAPFPQLLAEICILATTDQGKSRMNDYIKKK